MAKTQIVPGYTSLAAAEKASVDCYNKDCDQKGCPTPPEERGTTYAFGGVQKHPTKKEWAMILPPGSDTELLTTAEKAKLEDEPPDWKSTEDVLDIG